MGYSPLEADHNVRFAVLHKLKVDYTEVDDLITNIHRTPIYRISIFTYIYIKYKHYEKYGLYLVSHVYIIIYNYICSYFIYKLNYIKMDSSFQISGMLYFRVEDWVYPTPQEEAHQIYDHTHPPNKIQLWLDH